MCLIWWSTKAICNRLFGISRATSLVTLNAWDSSKVETRNWFCKYKKLPTFFGRTPHPARNPVRVWGGSFEWRRKLWVPLTGIEDGSKMFMMPPVISTLGRLLRFLWEELTVYLPEGRWVSISLQQRLVASVFVMKNKKYSTNYIDRKLTTTVLDNAYYWRVEIR